ncbi:hypothetical protein N9X92_06555, partial [Gammaproteobacteria bacterium]|nr:hypothetical protein [Gammaproteobacteria bacterium]
MFYTQLEGQRAPVSATDSARLIKWRLSTFWVMLVGYVGYYICRGNLSAAFPLLEQEFGYSNTQLGLIVSLSEIAYAVGKLLTGLWRTASAAAVFSSLAWPAQFSGTLFSLCRARSPHLLLCGAAAAISFR